MNAPPKSSWSYKHTLRPEADAIRAQLDQIPVLQARVMVFGSWVPSANFYRWTGIKSGKFFSVRKYKGKTYVFRLE